MLTKLPQPLNELFAFCAPFTEAAWFRALLPVCLVVVFFPNFTAPPAQVMQNSQGGFLLAGLPHGAITWQMPFFPSAISFLLHLGLPLNIVASVLHAAVAGLCFVSGSLLGGYWAGILSLAGIGLFAASPISGNYEQIFYSFFLLLIFCLLLLKRRDDKLLYSLLCALAIGASLLVRTPLFLFPAVVVFFDWLRAKERPVPVWRHVLFLGLCYVLLVPWGFLNYSLSGKVEFLENERAADNILTAAMGSVYTMEGSARRAAGIGDQDSAFAFFAREVAAHPLRYGLGTAKRLWHIFLFQPWLFAFFGAAMLLYRGRDRALVFMLPLYLVAIHSLLSVESRYFYPVVYLLPPLIAGTFLRAAGAGGERVQGLAHKVVITAFCVMAAAVLGLEGLLMVYPWRAANTAFTEDMFSRASARFPREQVFYERKCREIWRKGEDAGFYACLGVYSRKYGDEVKAYFLAAMAAGSAREIPAPPCTGANTCAENLIVKMLRELDLGDQAAAGKSFNAARAAHQVWGNGLRGEPYERDREINVLIRRDSSSFENGLYNVLTLWPVSSMGRIIAGIEKQAVLPARLRQLRQGLNYTRGAGKAGELRVREWIISDIFFPPAVPPERWGNGDDLVAKTLSGPAAAGVSQQRVNALMTEPEALMRLCSAPRSAIAAARLLDACQRVVYLTGTAGGDKPLNLMGLDAALESCKLLAALGRKEEAGATLLWLARTAPPGWPGLVETRRLLAAGGIK